MLVQGGWLAGTAPHTAPMLFSCLEILRCIMWTVPHRNTRRKGDTFAKRITFPTIWRLASIKTVCAWKLPGKTALYEWTCMRVKRCGGKKKQCVCASIFSIYDMMKIGIFHKKNRKPRIRSYLFVSSYVLFPFSPVRFDFVSSHVCLTAFHGESASVHLVGLTHKDCEEKIKQDMPPTQARRRRQTHEEKFRWT